MRVTSSRVAVNSRGAQLVRVEAGVGGQVRHAGDRPHPPQDGEDVTEQRRGARRRDAASASGSRIM